MTFRITKHDREITENIIFKFRQPAKGDLGEGKVEFQFPPKITSDSRKSTWVEEDRAGGKEPVANFKTSGPRDITMSWTYILTDDGGGEWDITRVRDNVNRIRGYFASIYGASIKKKSGSKLIIDFRYAAITGIKTWTCRMKSIDVKYSDNIVGPPFFGYPLRTDITIDLKLWTTNLTVEQAERLASLPSSQLAEALGGEGALGGVGAVADIILDNLGDTVQSVINLPLDPQPSWGDRWY